MDSFFEPLKTIPEPTTVEKFIHNSGVPEVSMINVNKASIDSFCPNNIWKYPVNPPQFTGTYKNFQEQFGKKQVRFENPTSCVNKITAHNEPKFGKFRSESPQPFEKIYMANIPDRKLDLSIIDVKNDRINDETRRESDDSSVKSDDLKSDDNDSAKELSENKENCIPKTYRDFLEMQKKATKSKPEQRHFVKDILNYKKNNTDERNNSVLGNKYLNQYENNKLCVTNIKCDSGTQTSNENADFKALQIRDNLEPSNNELLKIISQQNEQILLLQRQVAMLLERDRISDSIEGSDHLKNEKRLTPSKNHFRHENKITQEAGIYQDNQRKWGMSKFSINLTTTTSFEMPVRPHQKHHQHFTNQEPKIQEVPIRPHQKHHQHFTNQEPKIQEVIESSELSPKTDNLEPSLHLLEPMNVREPCLSPQPSINIKMNDYESSDEEEASSDIGTTFYNNLMGQVNNMLKKAKEEDALAEDSSKSNKTLNRVKEATMKHLKNVGINVDFFNTTNSDANTNYSPSEISCTVKQLLMKYLPADQIGQVNKINCASQAPGDQKPDFSVASLEYMKKYNLLPSKEKVPDFILPTRLPQNNGLDDNRKILDLTALKMQPKLM